MALVIHPVISSYEARWKEGTQIEQGLKEICQTTRKNPRSYKFVLEKCEGQANTAMHDTNHQTETGGSIKHQHSWIKGWEPFIPSTVYLSKIETSLHFRIRRKWDRRGRERG